MSWSSFPRRLRFTRALRLVAPLRPPLSSRRKPPRASLQHSSAARLAGPLSVLLSLRRLLALRSLPAPFIDLGVADERRHRHSDRHARAALHVPLSPVAVDRVGNPALSDQKAPIDRDPDFPRETAERAGDARVDAASFVGGDASLRRAAALALPVPLPREPAAQHRHPRHPDDSLLSAGYGSVALR